MLIKEFIEKYCADIVEKYVSMNSDPLSSDDFSYDVIIYCPETDREEKAIHSDNGEEILVRHILELNEVEFIKIYSSAQAMKAYKAYLSSFEILYGTEALIRVQREIRALKEKLDIVREVGNLVYVQEDYNASSFGL